MPEVRIGCSGFMYDHWRGPFYPPSLSKQKYLNFYTERFNTVEMNVTFYRLPPEKTFLHWYTQTPEGFSFSVKGSRFITHIKRLKDPEEALSRFMQRAMNLREKLSIVLWQFPPQFKADRGRLREFVSLFKGYRVRATFEFRHQSWISSETTRILEEAGFSYCMADWPEFNRQLPLTTDYVYIRRHGHGGSYDTCYSREELKADAEMIRDYLRDGMDVYIYFNNDAYGYAPQNAQTLKELLGTV